MTLYTLMYVNLRIQVLATEGKDAFYSGRIGQAIVDSVQAAGGVMTLDDMTSHTSTYEEPISVEYRGVRLWETQPSSHGIVALMTLEILKHFNMKGNPSDDVTSACAL